MIKTWKLIPLVATAALVGCGDDKPLTENTPSDPETGDTTNPNLGPVNPDQETPDVNDPEINEPEPEPMTELSGNVADGYLTNALVCLDANLSMTCDPEEPRVYSGAGGAWTLNVPESAREDGGRIVAEAQANVTTDEDTGNAIPNSYTLMADFPALEDREEVFVSPLTTLVAHEAIHGQLDTVEDAETAVKARLATMASLTSDYIAEKANSRLGEETQQEFEYLHRIAQIMATMKGVYEKQLREAGYNQAKAVESSTTKVRSILDVITADARASLSSAAPFNPNSIIASGNYSDLIPPASPKTDDVQQSITLADMGDVFEGETPFFTSNGNPVSQLSTTETRARYNPSTKQIDITAFASTLMSAQEAPEAPEGEGEASEQYQADLWYQQVPQVIQFDSNRGTATLVGNVDAEPTPVVAWSPEANRFVESASYPATLGLRSIKNSDGNVQGSVFAGAVTTTTDFTKILTGYLSLNELFDWQFGHTAPERFFLKTNTELTNWETPLFTYEETLDETLVVAPLHTAPGTDNAVQLSDNTGFTPSLNALIGDTNHRIDGLRNKSGDRISMHLTGTPDNGTITLRNRDGQVIADTGSYTLNTTPIPHLRIALPSSYGLPEIQRGFELGYPVIAEMQGFVRLAWVLPENTNTSTLFGGNGTNMEYPISYKVIKELSRTGQVNIPK